MQGLWLYIRFNALQLSSIVVDDAQLAWHSEKPIGIYEPRTNQLCQINPAAKVLGLRTNMGLAAASALCAELEIIEYDVAQENKLLKSIAQQLYGVTADISLDKPNGLYLRVDNMLQLYGDLASYWQVISNILNALDCGYNYASAYSISAAKVLAKAAYNHISDDQQQWKRALCRSALRHSDLTEKQLTSLRRVGIHSFTDLFKQPVSAIAARFDGDMLRYLTELKGERFSQLPLYRPERQFEQQVVLLYEINTSERLLKPLHSILLKLEHFLVQRGLVAFDLHIELHLRDNESQPTQSWLLHCAQGENGADTWLDIASISVERLKLLAPVQGLTLFAKQLANAIATNDDLFTGKQHTINNLHLLARLHAKLGQNAITQIQLGDDHRPEYMSKVVTPGTLAKTTSKLTQTHSGFQDRPALILNQPTPLKSHSKILSPPERIITGWWDSRSVSRDYFVAQNTQGQYLWVFRTPGNEWFVHGYFA